MKKILNSTTGTNAEDTKKEEETEDKDKERDTQYTREMIFGEFCAVLPVEEIVDVISKVVHRMQVRISFHFIISIFNLYFVMFLFFRAIGKYWLSSYNILSRKYVTLVHTFLLLSCS
jgi:hypothetical protein